MYDKIKIAFIMPYLGCGGVESTLFSLLEVLDYEKYDISLLLLEKKGAFLSRIPKRVSVEEIEIPEHEHGIFFGKKKQVQTYLKQGSILKAANAFYYNSTQSITEDRTKNVQYFDEIADTIPENSKYYDVAIDYFGYATFTTFYLVEKINAKLKISWLHSIFSRFHPEAFEKYYKKIDVFYAVSEMVKEDFNGMFSLGEQVEIFHNIINTDKIRQRALESGGFGDDFTGNRILTVGRVTYEKGTDLAVEALKRLIDEGYNVRWYAIGAGEEIELLKDALKGTLYEKCFVFLGMKENPYPYMEQCDIYVQPSRFEGYCTTTNEARIIGCPVVTTDVSGAREQFEDGKTGFVVNCDVEEIYYGVKKLLDEPKLRTLFAENSKNINYDTRSEIAELYCLFEKI